MVERFEHLGSFGSGADVAGVFVLQADDHVVLCRLVRQSAQRRDDAVEALLGPHGPPIRKHADDFRAGLVRNLEGALGQPWLIFESVLGGEDVVLEPRIGVRGVGQDALQHRRRDRNDLLPRVLTDRDRAVQLLIGQVHNVLSEHHAEFGAGHSDLLHGSDGDFNIRRELVGDGGYRVK